MSKKEYKVSFKITEKGAWFISKAWKVMEVIEAESANEAIGVIERKFNAEIGSSEAELIILDVEKIA